MDTSVKGWNKWANAHTYYSIDILRIVLGAFLLFKGGYFITHSGEFVEVIGPVSNFLGGQFPLHYIASAHIMGGILIAFGLLTRWCIIAELPILIGAFVVNFVGEMNTQNLILSFLTLCVCVFFLFYGSGKNSADYYFKMQK
jgi:putative oxidoreductase